MQIFRNYRDAIKRWLRYDEVRIPVQTTSAVLLAYVVGSIVDPENISWAVFSSLFVVQASIGGTVSAALGRMAGALLGAALAVLLVMVLGEGNWRSALALVIGVGFMSVLTARWPILGYGLVTVTIIAVAPEFALVEGAFKKVVAIVVGSSCGIAAAFAVLPMSACRSQQAYLAAALRSCGDFVVECTSCLVGGREGKNRSSDRLIGRALDGAREMSRQARIEAKAPIMRHGFSVDALLPEIERFRYTLTLLDRYSDEPISEELLGRHKMALVDLADDMARWLKVAADAIESGQECTDLRDVWGRYKELSEHMDVTVDEGRLSAGDTERMMALKGAFYTVLSNMTSLAEQVNHCRDRAQQAT